MGGPGKTQHPCTFFSDTDAGQYCRSWYGSYLPVGTLFRTRPASAHLKKEGWSVDSHFFFKRRYRYTRHWGWEETQSIHLNHSGDEIRTVMFRGLLLCLESGSDNIRLQSLQDGPFQDNYPHCKGHGWDHLWLTILDNSHKLFNFIEQCYSTHKAYGIARMSSIDRDHDAQCRGAGRARHSFFRWQRESTSEDLNTKARCVTGGGPKENWRRLGWRNQH